MDAIIVVDMQVGLLGGPSKLDLPGVVARINRLTTKVRAGGGAVIFIQHSGRPGDGFARGEPGWALLPELVREPSDIVVAKTLNDPFVRTELDAALRRLAPDRVLITGWATDFCVDSTVRSAVSHGYDVVAVADGHTLNDRPGLDAQSVIRHHNWLWSELITDRSIRVVSTAELLAEA
ncbi:MAG: isochorismatase family protein [Alphaproteobacteria bacterium]|nr:isochorismatase family protein [Alphaproteobacteria bacterium]